ncbi:MAG: hypothetical protein NTZ78_05265 [Candidatus Aureabacteria bacterium]|nr:hypothetical protein [Candidatus Auribacterota bacterium]
MVQEQARPQVVAQDQQGKVITVVLPYQARLNMEVVAVVGVMPQVEQEQAHLAEMVDQVAIIQLVVVLYVMRVAVELQHSLQVESQAMALVAAVMLM